MNEDWHNGVLVVIPSLNGAAALARMLPTLRFPSSGVVVLDQGSTDETAGICAAHGVGIVQLGGRHSHSQTVNVGLAIARERGRRYLCVASNAVAFRTDVLAELAGEMGRDPALGIVAPAQVLVGDAEGAAPLAYRAVWNLHELRLQHDTEPRDGAIRRIEADFCDLTCALIRMSAVDDIGVLDEEYGVRYGDADLGFRLRKAGYSCAYLPPSQIDHFTAAASGRTEAEGVTKDTGCFIRKHLGFGFAPTLDVPDLHVERSLGNQGLQAAIRRGGLIDDAAPSLRISQGQPDFDGYLYTSLDGELAWDRWLAEPGHTLRAIFTPSVQVRDQLVRGGFLNGFHVPLGIEPDVFHPWVAAHRHAEEATSYLAIVHGQQTRLLRTILDGWARFAARNRVVRLVLYGPGLGGCIGRPPDSVIRAGNAEVAHYAAERIDVRDALWPLSGSDLARLYRAFDYVVTGSRGEDAALAVLQAAACGVPCIAVGQPGAAGFSVQDAVMTERLVNGRVCEADGLDPAGARFLASLESTLRCSARDRAGLALDGVNLVRNRFSLRSSAMGLYHALSQLQIRRPSRVLARVERKHLTSALPDESVLAAPARRRGAAAAQRVAGLGRIAEQFGETWQDEGLANANKVIVSELGYFIAGRARQVLRRGLALVPRRQAGRTAAIPASPLLIGDFGAQVGSGSPLRSLAVAMSRTGVDFGIYPLDAGVSDEFMPERHDLAHAHAVNIVGAAPDNAMAVFDTLGPGYFDRSYTILQTGWKVSQAFRTGQAPLGRVDEFWVPDASVAQSVRTVFGGTITIVPPCVEPVVDEAVGPQRLGLEGGVFCFAAAFGDCLPRPEDPLAVVRAFRTAFAGSDARVALLIRTDGTGERSPTLRNDLCVAALDDDRIRLLDDAITRTEMLSLIAAAACYVSPYARYGNGPGVVEAMMLGTPVIAMGHAGAAGGPIWAAPDEAACAAAMVRVLADPGEAAVRAAEAQRFAVGRYGPEAVGRVVERRLAEIGRLRSQPATTPEPGSTG